MNKPHIMLYPLFLIVLTTSCASKKLDEKVNAYQEAHNNNDIEKALSLLTEDIKYEVVGEWTLEGKEKLRKLFETDADTNSKQFFTDIKVGENKVTFKFTEQNDWLKLARIDALLGESGQFIFEKGLIKVIRLKRSQESIMAMRKFRSSFGRWAANNRMDELSKLKGTAVLAREDLPMFMRMMRDWRKAMEEKGWEEEEQIRQEDPNGRLFFYKATRPGTQPTVK
jgi:hypothetical protein